MGFTTRDVTARATGEILWSPDESVPFLDLSLGFSDGDLARLEYFIPTAMFGEQTGAWLDQAFPRGRLSAGTVQLRGYPRPEFDTESDFSVTVHATVHDTTVHYLDGWPSPERVAGTVRRSSLDRDPWRLSMAMRSFPHPPERREWERRWDGRSA